MNKKGFTLVELLVVIAIIGVLASIVVPSVGKVKEKAMKAKARTEVQSIANAIKAYYSDYSKFPLQEDTNESFIEMDGELTGTLRGLLTESSQNPRKIIYLEVNSQNLDDSSGNAANAQMVASVTELDGNGKKTTTPAKFNVLMDYDFSKSLTLPDSSGADDKELEATTVAVWVDGYPEINSWD